MQTRNESTPWPRTSRLVGAAGCVAVLVLTFIAYTPILRNQFTNWDDQAYVTDNEMVRGLDGPHLTEMFTTYCMGNYHPLTMLSIAFNYRVGGLDPRPYFLTQIILHLTNTFLAFCLARMLLGNVLLATITAALFGVHTLHVESVAWASARKDLLYGLFFFAALIAWMRYRNTGRLVNYVASLLLCLASLLSKGMAVALYPTLWALELFRPGRKPLRRTLLETAPFGALALAFGVVAVLAQRDAQAIPENTYAGYQRLAFAAYGFVQYAWRLVAPFRLSAIYPYPSAGPGVVPLQYWLSLLPALGLLALALFAARRQRLVGFGIVFFIINIALVLQVIPVGDAVFADRYVYVASFGAFLAAAAAVGKLLRGRLGGPVTYVTLGLYVLFLAALTFSRCHSWRDSLTLWNDILAKHPHAVQALNDRGEVLFARGDLTGAISDYTAALQLRPWDPRYHYNRGAARLQAGDLAGARADFIAVIEAGSLMQYEAYCGRGTVQRRLGDLPGAIADFTLAMELDPSRSVAWLNRGMARYLAGDLQACVDDLDQVLRLNPEEAQALTVRGKARVDMGRSEEGCADLLRAGRLGSAAASQMWREHCDEDPAAAP